MSSNWYVITGGPSTGKTTLLEELEKLGHKVMPEAARTVIDRAQEKGISVKDLRSNEKHFQEEVARLKQQMEASHDKKVLTFLDRGMHDTLAYMRYYNFRVESWMEKLMKDARYQKVFLLEPLPTYETDYARTENQDFTSGMHSLLHDAYAEFGMKPICIPALGVDDRLKLIIDKVKAEQTV